MEPMNKCPSPSCQKPIAKAVLSNMPIGSLSRNLSGVSFCCPHCHSILGVAIDPAALVADVLKALKGAPKS